MNEILECIGITGLWHNGLDVVCSALVPLTLTLEPNLDFMVDM